MSLLDRIAKYEKLMEEAVPEFKIDGYDRPVNVLEDVVVKKSSEREFMYQKFFSDLVLEGVSPHFPLVYGHRYEEDKVLFSMEKFDEDFDYLNYTKKNTIEMVVSAFLQALMILHVIDSYGKFHGDLNPGNVMMKKIDTDEEVGGGLPGHIKYTINGETMYIKHYGRLWVVIDFEFTGDKGVELAAYDSSFKEDFFIRLFDKERFDNLKRPVRGSWLYDIFVLTKFMEADKMTERVYDLIQDDYPFGPVDAIPLIIKNDYSEILVREP
jgi:hypothetical protein